MATFQDMLTSPHDEDLFQHFATSQLARIDTETGQIERIGPAALITGVDPSPDEKYLLVSTVRRPFSYRVPVRLLHSQDRGVGRRRPAGRHGRRPADLRRHPPPGCANRPSRRAVAASPRRPTALDRGTRRRRPANEGSPSRQDHGARCSVHRQTRRGDEGPASLLGLRLAPRKRSSSRQRVRPRPSLADHDAGRSDQARAIAQGPLRPEHQ